MSKLTVRRSSSSSPGNKHRFTPLKTRARSSTNRRYPLRKRDYNPLFLLKINIGAPELIHGQKTNSNTTAPRRSTSEAESNSRFSAVPEPPVLSENRSERFYLVRLRPTTRNLRLNLRSAPESPKLQPSKQRRVPRGESRIVRQAATLTEHNKIPAVSDLSARRRHNE
ncbi:Hypothetical predicted protein [Xyrichtys novacula]|uniref:Uncharacterized protein n=1 Tax=Xyrichtys novacula TaxID=13765 RepID=A0AAV1EMS9_XYRNO|nr:Hypothetical predicted protein [Xyrichtys novacula]